MTPFKIKQGGTPTVFKAIPVTFILADGQQGAIDVVFKYRTRKGYGAFMDQANAKAREKMAALGNSLEGVHKVSVEADVEVLLASVDSWTLDVELVPAELDALADEAPAIVSAVAVAYRRACIEGHLGN